MSKDDKNKNGENVVDLHSDKPSPLTILKGLISEVEQIDNLVAVIIRKDGQMRIDTSHMDMASFALMVQLAQFDMFKQINETISEGDEDET
jgi:hypothetical protein